VDEVGEHAEGWDLVEGVLAVFLIEKGGEERGGSTRVIISMKRQKAKKIPKSILGVGGCCDERGVGLVNARELVMASHWQSIQSQCERSVDLLTVFTLQIAMRKNSKQKKRSGGGLEPYIALAIWEVGDSLLALLNCWCCYRQGCFLVSLPGTSRLKNPRAIG
jgi:hypothetical protein